MLELEHAGTPPQWQIGQKDNRIVLGLAGDWIAQSGTIPSFPYDRLLQTGHIDVITFETSNLGRWDSGLIAFLWDAKRAATALATTIDPDGLPSSARKLLGLLSDRSNDPVSAPIRHFRPLFWLGGKTADQISELGLLSILLADIARGTALYFSGRVRMRAVDLVSNIQDAGPSALIIVAVVNFLIGSILAFVGAVQLKKFAADVYVADLVGLAVVREMAAVVTAIVIAGRTGGAYAARIATMRGNEELDALEVVGIPISDYIILPAVLALVFTTPILYLYGCLMGIIGGLTVSLAMLDITPLGFLQQMLSVVPVGQFAFGFVKSIGFAVMIGLTSCRIGLKAGRSAADVGLAATSAVVIGIVGVIAMDAVFAVLAQTLGV